MGKNPRPLRVADRIQEELGEIFARRMKDPRLGFVTVTGVDVSPDLRVAKIFISALTKEEADSGMEALDRAKGFLRSELGSRLSLRYVPELIFKVDEAAERGQRIEELLRELKNNPSDEGEDQPQ